MPDSVLNPALEAFLQLARGEVDFGQIQIRPAPKGFALRHIDDRDSDPPSLRAITLPDIRALADFTPTGTFRPLKSAPNLQRGWRLLAESPADLELALNRFYPGAIADWFAARSPAPPVTNYREFTGRQTGMYRISQMLTDEQAAQAIQAACPRQLCLKQRLWTVAGLNPDPPTEKSLIPCLEPCALLLEFARKSMRIIQEEPQPLRLSASEWATAQAALELALAASDAAAKEGDFNAPLNPRRIQGLVDKIRGMAGGSASAGEAE